jgi:hypothetical protein
MSNQSHKAGASTRELAKKRWIKGLLIFWSLIAIIGGFIALIANQKELGLGGIGVFVLLVFMQLVAHYFDNRLDTQMKTQRRAVRGAVGEEVIGALLQTLPDDFLVLHDVVSQYGNIDHIVLSKKGGVFLIETKAHYGYVMVQEDKLLVNGKPPEKNFIYQILNNTYWLREQIETVIGVKPWVNGIIVFTKAIVPSDLKIKNIILTDKNHLLSSLQGVSFAPVTQKVWEQREEISKKLLASVRLKA